MKIPWFTYPSTLKTLWIMSATNVLCFFFLVFYDALNFGRLWTLKTTLFFFGWFQVRICLPVHSDFDMAGWKMDLFVDVFSEWIYLDLPLTYSTSFHKGQVQQKHKGKRLVWKRAPSFLEYFVSMSQQRSPGQRNLLQPARPDMISSVIFSSSPNKQFVKHGMSKQHWWL